MLIGQYEGKVDTKSRIALPARFRTILGDKLILTFGYENSLIVVSQRTWETLLAGTAGRPFIERATRETQRFLLGGATACELDSKGRFIIPAYLRTFAGIEEEAIFLGLSTYIELWSKKRWIEEQKYLEKNIEKISQRLVDDARGQSSDLKHEDLGKGKK